MTVLDNLATGFAVAGSLQNLTYCLIGALVGTLIGILPGLGVTATVAMLLPVTFYLPPAASLIMLAGIYYGAQYGGSTTAILVNLPGESSSVVTCIDGYRMARNGRAGPALAIAALGSLFAGCAATLVLVFFAPVLSRVALLFGPAEYFGIMLLGLVAAVVLAQGPILKALAMVVLGLLLGLAGNDVSTGQPRMTFGLIELSEGINFVPLAVGLFAIPEILRTLEASGPRSVISDAISRLWPSREDFRRSLPAVCRGTAIGSVLGLLPGGGSLLASFSAYVLEKKVSRTPGEFGNGAIEGVAGPEAANNAGAQTSFIPLLTLGIPSNAVMALMAGAMTMQGIQPGPDVITSQPQLFWGLIASMFIGNVMLVIINLPLIRVWIKLLKVPYAVLYPAILVFCSVGVYSVNNSAFDLLLMMGFGVLGYAFWKWQCEPAPLVLAFIIGPLMEEYLQRALLMSRGSLAIFVESPLSVALLSVSLAFLLMTLMPMIRERRSAVFEEG